MGRIFDAIFFVITAPLRLFGRSRGFRLIIGGLVVIAVFFAATMWVLDRYFPSNHASRVAAKLAPLPPLRGTAGAITALATSDAPQTGQLSRPRSRWQSKSFDEPNQPSNRCPPARHSRS